MTPKQNRGAGKRRSPAVPLDYYESRAEKRQSNLFFIFCNHSRFLNSELFLNTDNWGIL
jgi:hypothetical protein